MKLLQNKKHLAPCVLSIFVTLVFFNSYPGASLNYYPTEGRRFSFVEIPRRLFQQTKVPMNKLRTEKDICNRADCQKRAKWYSQFHAFASFQH